MIGATDIRVGLVGAGYVADWHADAIRATPGLALAAVCDSVPDTAQGFGEARGQPWFTSLDALLEARLCDAVHVLTPPPSHRALALQALDAGLHVLVEKPLALASADVRDMTEAARSAGRHLGVSHNFLGLPSHVRLKHLVTAGQLGRLVELRVDWALPFPPLQSGPYGLWALRAPENLLWEIGPHPFSFVQDLLGAPKILHLEVGQPVERPGGGSQAQSWRTLGRVGSVDVTINLSLAQTHEHRTVMLRGSSGLAQLDYARDALTIAAANPSDLVLNALRAGLSVASQQVWASIGNAGRQALSLNRRSPYALSFRGTLAGFYDGIRKDVPDPRFAPAAALTVATAIEDTLVKLPRRPPPSVAAGRPAPEVAIVGGTGFIGRAATRALAAAGRDVRVLSRRPQDCFPDIADRVELRPVDPSDPQALACALRGMKAVVNLARARETTLEAALANDVGLSVRLAQAAADAGVERFVHTGTIASYDMSDGRAVINEDTPFGPLERRNVYARAKAEGEARVADLCAARGLELVIIRPGIVLGREGPLQHWGLGRWHGAGAVRLWNDGRNILPFILVRDVADGIRRAIESNFAPGHDFNLVGDPMLTARDYFDEIARRLRARIHVASGSPDLMWATYEAKAVLKRLIRGRKDVPQCSRADWFSRGHLARFDNARPKALLGWRPEADREAFLRQAIDEAGLFGV